MKNKRRNGPNVSKSSNEIRKINTRKTKSNKTDQDYTRNYKSTNAKITKSSFVSSSSSSSSSLHNVLDSSKSVSENQDPYSLAKMDEEDIKIPTKRIKINEKRSTATPIIQNASSGPNYKNMGTNTDPELLGPCEPGTCIELHGIVWLETKSGLLILNVSWRGKSYVGALMDSSKYHGSPFNFQKWPYNMMNGTSNSANKFPNFLSSLDMTSGNNSTNYCTHDNYGHNRNHHTSADAFDASNESGYSGCMTSDTSSLDRYSRTPYMNNRPTRYIRKKQPLYHHYYQQYSSDLTLETINNSKSKRHKLPNSTATTTTNNQSDPFNTPTSASNTNRYKLRRKRNIETTSIHQSIELSTSENLYHHPHSNNLKVTEEKCRRPNCEKKFNNEAALHYHELLGHRSDGEEDMKCIDEDKDVEIEEVYEQHVNEKENENDEDEEETKTVKLEEEEEDQHQKLDNKDSIHCDGKEENIERKELIDEESKPNLQTKEEKIVKEEFPQPFFPIHTEITTMQSSALSPIPTSLFLPPQTGNTTKIVTAPLASIPVEATPRTSVTSQPQYQQAVLAKIQQQRPITNPYIIPQAPVIKKRPIYPQKATLSASTPTSNSASNTAARKTPQIPRQCPQTIQNLQNPITIQTQPSAQQALKPIQPRPSPSNTTTNPSLLSQPATTQLTPLTTPTHPPQTIVQQRQILPHPSSLADPNNPTKNPHTSPTTSSTTNSTNTVRHRRRRRQIASGTSTNMKPSSHPKIASMPIIDTTAPPVLEQQQEINSTPILLGGNSNSSGSNSGNCSSGSSNGCFNPLVIATTTTTTSSNATNSPNIIVNHNCVIANSLSPPPVLSPSATLSPPLFSSSSNTPVTSSFSSSTSVFLSSPPPLLNSPTNTNYQNKSPCIGPSYSSMNYLNVKVPISSNSTSHSPNGKYQPIIKNICPATPKSIPSQRATIAMTSGNQAIISKKPLSTSENDRINNNTNTNNSSQ